MIRLVCSHPLPEGYLCQGAPDAHVHQPTPCENGADERHHAFVPDRERVQGQVAGLAGDLATIAPVLSRRQRIALRKALVLP